jgi:hypothetical protein
MRRLLPLAAALAACSVPSRDFVDMGGATDAAPDAAPDAVPDAAAGPDAVPDAVPAPLALVSIAPDVDAVGVDRATSIILTFDAEITAASAAAAIQITDRRGDAIDGELAVSGATATFRPARPLAMLAAYETRVSGDLRGTAGGALAEPVTASFTTRDGAWSASGALVQATVTCADTAIDANGAAITAWEQPGESGRRNIWGAVGDGEPERLSITDTAAFCPRLAASRDGTALVVWTQSGQQQQLMANHRTADAGWRGPVTIDTLRGGTLHALAVDAQGNAHIAYSVNGITWVRRWDRATETWLTPVALVKTQAELAATARIGTSADGGALVVWRTSAGDLWSGHLPSMSTRILGNGGPEMSAVDRAGNALLVWEAGSRMRARYYRAATSSWEAEGPIGDEIEAPVDPAVAFADDGPAVAVWANQSDIRRRGLWARSFDPAHGWVGELVMLDRVPPNWGEPPISAQPRVAFDGAGRLLAVWVQSDTARSRIWWNRRSHDGVWQGAAVLDDSTDGTASAPRLAVDSTGAAHVVWSHTTPEQVTSLRATRFE